MPYSSILKAQVTPSSFSPSSHSTKPNLKQSKAKLKITNASQTKLSSMPLTISRSSVETAATSRPTSNRLQLLVSEFKSLPEPIDRVKRLLHYAEILPTLDESARVQENRVSGCTSQVWLDVEMDERGKMRFRAYSDSEITKGFCSCLIMILDGAEPEEVFGVKTEDLTEMNVGVHGSKTTVSRVNTWHNVLVVMQKKTHCLVSARDDKFFAGIFPNN